MNGVEMCRIYTPSFKNSELIDRDNQRTKRNRKWLMSVVSGRFFRSGKFLRVVKITKCEQFLIVKEYGRQSKQFVLISVLIFSRFLDASHSDQQNSHTPVRWNDIQIERVSLSPGLATFSTEEHEALFGTGEIDLASSNSSKSSSSSFASALASPGPKRSSPRAGQFSSGSGSPGNPGDPGGSGDPEGLDSCSSEITKPPSVEKVEVTEERATFIENTIKKLKKDLAEESESEESDSELESESEELNVETEAGRGRGTKNPHDYKSYGTEENPVVVEYEYRRFMQEMSEKYPGFTCSQERYEEMITRRLDGQTKPDRRGVLEGEGMFKFEAKGYVRNLRRPNNNKCPVDFEGEGQGPYEGYRYFEHSRPLAEETLEARQEKVIPVEEQALNIGKKKVKQVNNAVELNFENGPKSAKEILVNVQLDDIVDPSQKRAAVEKCLNAVEEAGGDPTSFIFTDFD
jgi:hypothetical protein